MPLLILADAVIIHIARCSRAFLSCWSIQRWRSSRSDSMIGTRERLDRGVLQGHELLIDCCDMRLDLLRRGCHMPGRIEPTPRRVQGWTLNAWMRQAPCLVLLEIHETLVRWWTVSPVA